MSAAQEQKMRAPPEVNHYLGYHLEKLTALRIALCTDKVKFDLNPSMLAELLNLSLPEYWLVFVEANKLMVSTIYEICGEWKFFVW
jgi:hypothetical protein